MRVADVESEIERWSPRWTAWERDNVGLQLGDPNRPVKSILVALDVTERVAAEAIRRRADLIVAHHPLLFRMPKTITASDDTGRLVLRLAEHKVSVLAAHTNLDFTKGGVSFALADALHLTGTRFLVPLKDTLAKMVVFVPESSVQRVVDAMASAGGGTIGEYSACSFRSPGRGTFRGSAASNPTVGQPGRWETVQEERVEMLVPRARVGAVTAAMKKVHPYEEAAYDVYPVSNPDPNFGMGAIGTLKRRTTLGAFLTSVRRTLRTAGLRYTGNPRRPVQTVAVCGGSGSDLLADAIAAGADAFVTADVRYHTYHAAHGAIALVDAGHYETEHVIIQPMVARLRALARGTGVAVAASTQSTNPVSSR